ncbi:MAG: VOC family protein [Bdellovibrionales bacterium]|nr:VOC family protein [Bdellovibrionales bacterium]
MIQAIDHIVMTVENIEETVHFYTTVLGMEKQVFGEGRIALVFGQQKINLHEYKKEFEPKADHPLPGSLDLCFISNKSLHQVIDILRKYNIDIIEGPVERTGAVGKISSIYLRDPSQNLIEISNYI